MSQVANQCVYTQMQRYSLTNQRNRRFEEQLCIFIATRIFDVALTAAAAVAATAAGAHVTGVPLTPAMLHAAAVGGGIKSGAMAFAGIVMLGPVSTPLIVLPVLLATSIGTNLVLVAAIGNRVIGHAPAELLAAAAVASIPLSLCLVYYYGAFHVPITITSIAFDVLGAYTFVKMADNLGYPICAPTTAATAGAVFSAVSSGATTLLSCCVIGRSRTIHLSRHNGGMHTRATASTGCCGNRVHVNSTMNEHFSDGWTTGHSSSRTTGTVSNSFHGLGAFWDPGVVNGYCGCARHSYSDYTTTQSHSNSTTLRMM